jgi:hypothetical protein
MTLTVTAPKPTYKVMWAAYFASGSWDTFSAIGPPPTQYVTEGDYARGTVRWTSKVTGYVEYWVYYDGSWHYAGIKRSVTSGASVSDTISVGPITKDTNITIGIKKV